MPRRRRWDGPRPGHGGAEQQLGEMALVMTLRWIDSGESNGPDNAADSGRGRSRQHCDGDVAVAGGVEVTARFGV